MLLWNPHFSKKHLNSESFLWIHLKLMITFWQINMMKKLLFKINFLKSALFKKPKTEYFLFTINVEVFLSLKTSKVKKKFQIWEVFLKYLINQWVPCKTSIWRRDFCLRHIWGYPQSKLKTFQTWIGALKITTSP